MRNIAKLATGLTTIALAMAATPVAAADPTIPWIRGSCRGWRPQSLSPVVQAAAADPASAQELLLAAASQLAGNATTGNSAALAEAVTRFVQGGGIAMGPAAPPAAALITQQAGDPAGGGRDRARDRTAAHTRSGQRTHPLEKHLPAAGGFPAPRPICPPGSTRHTRRDRPRRDAGGAHPGGRPAPSRHRPCSRQPARQPRCSGGGSGV